jgi:hypothetical protein
MPSSNFVGKRALNPVQLAPLLFKMPRIKFAMMAPHRTAFFGRHWKIQERGD